MWVWHIFSLVLIKLSYRYWQVRKMTYLNWNIYSGVFSLCFPNWKQTVPTTLWRWKHHKEILVVSCSFLNTVSPPQKQSANSIFYHSFTSSTGQIFLDKSSSVDLAFTTQQLCYWCDSHSSASSGGTVVSTLKIELPAAPTSPSISTASVSVQAQPSSLGLLQLRSYRSLQFYSCPHPVFLPLSSEVIHLKYK